MTFSEKLTGLRRKSGMSQEQLADRLGVLLRPVAVHPHPQPAGQGHHL